MFNYKHIISHNVTISLSHVTMTCACATYGRLAIPHDTITAYHTS